MKGGSKTQEKDCIIYSESLFLFSHPLTFSGSLEFFSVTFQFKFKYSQSDKLTFKWKKT